MGETLKEHTSLPLLQDSIKVEYRASMTDSQTGIELMQKGWMKTLTLTLTPKKGAKDIFVTTSFDSFFFFHGFLMFTHTREWINWWNIYLGKYNTFNIFILLRKSVFSFIMNLRCAMSESPAKILIEK